MWKERIIIIFIALAMAIALYSLPTVVVDNKNQSTSSRTSESQVTVNQPLGRTEIKADQKNIIQALRDSLSNTQNTKKSVIFADSLASLYSRISMFDSAAVYAAMTASTENSVERHLKAGNLYYQAFNFAANQEVAQEYAEKTRQHLNKVLEDSGSGNELLLDAKTKIALTYISSSNPMQGIFMLREVLEQNPEHELALLNMGLLSIKSGQYDKAAERFEKLVEVNPDNLDGHFYLGVSYIESGRQDLARKQFEKASNLNPPPQIEQAIDQYLKELNNIN